MDTQRAKKTRSLGANPTPSRQSTSGLRRADLAEKHYSVPAVVPKRQSEASRNVEGLKVADKSRRSSKASSRDDSAVRTPVPGVSQTGEQRRASAVSVKSNTQVSYTYPGATSISLTLLQSAEKDEIPVLTFAVIGNSRVGKSVFIRNALDLRRPNTSAVATSKVLLGGSLYRLQLIEVPLDSVTLSRNTILWSSIPALTDYPDVDGVLCLYDVSEQNSLEGIHQLLTALEQTNKTVCLVSCKVDVPLCDHEIGPSFIDRVSTEFPTIGFEEASIDSSDSAKRCLLKILKETLVLVRRESRLPNRARSGSNTSSTHPPRRLSQGTSSRSRSRSQNLPSRSRSRDNLLNVPPPPVIESEGEDEEEEDEDEEEEDETEEESEEEADSHNQSTRKMSIRVNTASIRPKLRVEKPQTPISSTENVSTRAYYSSERASRVVPQTPESYVGATPLRRGSADTAGSKSCKTFLDIDDESPADDTSPIGGEAESSRERTAGEDTSYPGVPFSELVDRLLAMPASKADRKFISSFLCLYRTFETPLSLLMAIVERFMGMDKSDLVAFAKTAELLRYLSVLGLWTAHYPGDFADTTVRDTISTFMTALEKNKNFAPSAKQIASNLQTVAPDEDEDWAFTGPGRLTAGKSPNSRRNTNSYPAQAKEAKSRQWHVEVSRDDEDSDSDGDIKTSSSARHSANTSAASSLLRNSQTSSLTSENLHHLETARENARKLRIAPTVSITKVHWHVFMSFTVEELAVEITRIDWTMYTAIRPRDFVRYVTIPSSQRSRSGRVDYVGMMTKHFNHLALFVSGMILTRDKPKHRAKMVEKFMGLAWKVRQMNNYHALGAIVAALSGEEIVRLAQTHELVSQDQQKQFMRLKILMGHQKSHAAYRMAWDNSSGERIPYLPRIQEDLTKAGQGNPTFIGGSKNINWRKFEIMGDTIVSIQQSQEQPYNFSEKTQRGIDMDKLILETKVLECEVSTGLVVTIAHTDKLLGRI